MSMDTRPCICGHDLLEHRQWVPKRKGVEAHYVPSVCSALVEGEYVYRHCGCGKFEVSKWG